MTNITLEEQKKRLAQRKARLQQQEALLKIKERKQKLSKQIRIGELAEKAGILELDLPTLLGAFLAIHELAQDKDQRNHWMQSGLRVLAPKSEEHEAVLESLEI